MLKQYPLNRAEARYEETVRDLGSVTEQTQGLPSGVWTEQSVMPFRNCKPGSPGC